MYGSCLSLHWFFLLCVFMTDDAVTDDDAIFKAVRFVSDALWRCIPLLGSKLSAGPSADDSCKSFSHVCHSCAHNSISLS
ncbi:hypothetical protein ACQKWADRAFT_307158 [Trichoderma austrokoningii]